MAINPDFENRFNPVQTLSVLSLLLLALGSAYGRQNPPAQALNPYIAFLNQTADLVANRLNGLHPYAAATRQFRTNPRTLLRLPSSGPIEEFYYRKALETANSSLNPPEIRQLQAEAQALWQLLEDFDQSGKALETYVRLQDYQRDGLKKSDALLAELQHKAELISRKRDGFYRQIQRIYQQHQPYNASDPYLKMEREMTQVLEQEQQLLSAWTYALNEESPSGWPVDRIRESMLVNVRQIAGFDKNEAGIAYPASSMVGSFRSALQAIQDVKQTAINDYNFAARKSARHGNTVYLNLINHYNNDLLAFYQAFVNYSASARQLLDYPKFCPLFRVKSAVSDRPKANRTEPFNDIPRVAFTVRPAAKPASEATFHALNAYIDFINESLRQMNRVQIQARNFQSSVETFRQPNHRRGQLSYQHDDYKIPAADYQLLLNTSQTVPEPYRTALNTQTSVLMNILNEMDGLGIELVEYTRQRQYEQDNLQRADAILDRYARLFDTFDRKKEELYTDVRRVHESYPTVRPPRSWDVAGLALLKSLDDERSVLFAVKSYYRGETVPWPTTEKLEENRRTLITDEYKNLKGLTRYGRSNGLCPYSPYEDLAENAGRFADKVSKARPASQTVPSYDAHPYESFYYFYNNELVYPYNKFSELAKTGVLKMINQPNLFVFQRPVTAKPPTETVTEKTETSPPIAAPTPTEAAPTLEGFAINNLVLLLDVSASMESPHKLPLLKKSIKALLPLLRPDDQISIVVYSGKAKVILQPTSGAQTAEIARAIDQLRSTGETDGNEGIRTAYKVASKHFIPTGNNRIVLATDGEFPISESVYESVGEFARKDIYLTVLTFGQKVINSANLKKLATLGQGSYEHVTEEKAPLQLVREAQAKRIP